MRTSSTSGFRATGRRCSLPSDGLFGPIFYSDAVRRAVDDGAWLAGMLAAERALAVASARAGVIPGQAAEAIAASCDASRFDPAALGAEGRRAGNPVEPLVRALRDAVGGEAAAFVHRGATSQDILDTAAMLVARDAVGLIVGDVGGAALACIALARRHRETPVAARTLLRQAVPTTFGLKAAAWLVGIVEARRFLLRVRDERLAAQLGGAAATLAALGDRGPEVLRLYAEELGLAAPVVPWHTLRARVAELGAALDVTAGSLAKVALDVVLLSQDEIAEVAEADAGSSSTLPQKRNAAGSVVALACARHVHAAAGVLSGGLPQELERAAGAWHAEWKALSDALAFTGGAAERVREVLEGLEVDAERMRANLDDSTLSERAVLELGVEREALAADPLREVLSQRLETLEVESALEPTSYLGAATELVDRAIAFAEAELGA